MPAWHGVQRTEKFAGWAGQDTRWGYSPFQFSYEGRPRRAAGDPGFDMASLSQLMQGFSTDQAPGVGQAADGGMTAKVLGAVGTAAPALATAAMAPTVANTVRAANTGARAGIGRVQGAGLGMLGHTTPEAMQAAQKAQSQGGRAMTRAAQATQLAKGPMSRVLPGLNVLGSGAGMAMDTYDVATGKEYQAPESGWGLVGDMALGALTPIGDIGAGATVGGLPGALAAGTARAALNVGRAGIESVRAGSALYDAYQSGQAADSAEARLRAFQEHQRQAGPQAMKFKEWKKTYSPGQSRPPVSPTPSGGSGKPLQPSSSGATNEVS